MKTPFLLGPYWDNDTIKSIIDNSIPRNIPRFNTPYHFELQISGSICELSPIYSDIVKAMDKSSGLCRVYSVNRISGRKVIILTTDKRPKLKLEQAIDYVFI
jgi:hypothetical protein